jgi:hypothetical protein
LRRALLIDIAVAFPKPSLNCNQTPKTSKFTPFYSFTKLHPTQLGLVVIATAQQQWSRVTPQRREHSFQRTIIAFRHALAAK